VLTTHRDPLLRGQRGRSVVLGRSVSRRYVASMTATYKVSVWELTTCRRIAVLVPPVELRNFRGLQSCRLCPSPHNNPVWRLDLGQDGERVRLSACCRRELEWTRATHAASARVDANNAATAARVDAAATDLQPYVFKCNLVPNESWHCISANNEVAVKLCNFSRYRSFGCVASVWHVEVRQRYPDTPSIVSVLEGYICDAAVSTDGRIVACSDNVLLRVWACGAQLQAPSLTANHTQFMCVQGRDVHAYDWRTRILDLWVNAVPAHVPAHVPAPLNPRIALQCSSANAMHMCVAEVDCYNSVVAASWWLPMFKANAAAFLPDGQRLLCGAADGARLYLLRPEPVCVPELLGTFGQEGPVYHVAVVGLHATGVGVSKDAKDAELRRRKDAKDAELRGRKDAKDIESRGRKDAKDIESRGQKDAKEVESSGGPIAEQQQESAATKNPVNKSLKRAAADCAKRNVTMVGNLCVIACGTSIKRLTLDQFVL